MGGECAGLGGQAFGGTSVGPFEEFHLRSRNPPFPCWKAIGHVHRLRGCLHADAGEIIGESRLRLRSGGLTGIG